MAPNTEHLVCLSIFEISAVITYKWKRESQNLSRKIIYLFVWKNQQREKQQFVFSVKKTVKLHYFKYDDTFLIH